MVRRHHGGTHVFDATESKSSHTESADVIAEGELQTADTPNSVLTLENESDSSSHFLELYRGDGKLESDSHPAFWISNGAHLRSGAAAAFYPPARVGDSSKIWNGEMYTLVLQSDGDFTTFGIESNQQHHEGDNTPAVNEQRKEDDTTVWRRFSDGSEFRETQPVQVTHSAIDYGYAGGTLEAHPESHVWDGGTSDHALHIQASDVTIRGVTAKTTGGGGASNMAIELGGAYDNALIEYFVVEDSDDRGVRLAGGSGHTVRHGTIESADSRGVEIDTTDTDVIDVDALGGDTPIEHNGTRGRVLNCVSKNGSFVAGIWATGDEQIIAGNLVDGSGLSASEVGIQLEGTEQVAYGNKFVNMGSSARYDRSSATRSLVDGRGVNAGDPTSTGQWNGNAQFAFDHNAVIEDTTNSNLYMAKSDGTWSQVGT